MKKLILLLIFLFLHISIFSKKKVIFLGNHKLPPMIYRNKNNKPEGLIIDLTKEIAKNMNYDVEIVVMDWSEAQKLLKEDNADALLQINKNPNRLKIFDFSETLLISEFSIFILNNRFGIKNKNDLRGLRVGVEKKGLPILVLKEDPLINIEIISDIPSGFDMLVNNKIDAVIVDRWVGELILAKKRIDNVKIVKEPIERSYSHIAVKKGDKKLLESINNSLRKIKKNGTYYKVIKKWRGKEIIYLTKDKFLSIGVAITVVIILVLTFLVMLYLQFQKIGKLNKKLLISEKNYRLLFENVTIAFCLQEMVYDEYGKPIDYIFLELNRLFEEYTGYKKENLIGQRVTKVLPETNKKLIETFGNIAKNNETLNYIKYDEKKDSYYDVRVFSPEKDRFAIFFIDITDKQKIEMEKEKLVVNLEQKNSEIVKRDKNKTEFINRLSHELRTPLNGIYGISKSILKNSIFQKNEEITYGLDMIKNSSERMLAIINDLLDINRIEAGKEKIDIRVINLNVFLTEIENFINSLLKSDKKKEKLVRFYYNKNENVSEFIKSDEKILNQILINLLGNSFKFTDNGKIVLNIYLKDNKLFFEVSDTGIGIKNKDIKKVFEKFETIEKNLNYKGSGLGLNLCKKLVKMLNGEIFIESQYNFGTSTKFFIEYQPTISKSENENIIQRNGSLDNSDLKNENVILVVEDENIGIETIKIMLQDKYNLDFAKDGKEALNKILNRKYSLVLLDIMLPEINGYEIFKIIKENKIKVPIVALTAMAMQSEKRKIKELGFDEYLSKPIDDELLIKIIKKYLGR